VRMEGINGIEAKRGLVLKFRVMEEKYLVWDNFEEYSTAHFNVIDMLTVVVIMHLQIWNLIFILFCHTAASATQVDIL
jgi:hypothetical protein